MTYHNEIAKEFLRDAFHSGALDITGSYETVRGFVQIFRGEMEALIAIQHCSFLDTAQVSKLITLAAPSHETTSHYQTWRTRHGCPPIER